MSRGAQGAGEHARCGRVPGAAEHRAATGTRRRLQGPTEPRACALGCGDVPAPRRLPGNGSGAEAGGAGGGGRAQSGSVAGAGALRATLGCRGEEGTVPSRVERRVGEAEQG